MANSITLAKKYIGLLDEVYQAESCTSDLDSDASLTREGANANEIVVPKMLLDGLGDYDRASGYAGGDTTSRSRHPERGMDAAQLSVGGDMSLTWETVKFNFDRGRRFNVDAMDDEETMSLAFGKLAGEFERTKVIPELDAFRFATYCKNAGATPVSAALTAGSSVVSALRAATTAMDDAEVPKEGRILYITSTLDGLIADMDTTASREVLARFSKKVLVPQARFYSAIDQLDGKSSGEEKGGYKKSDSGKNINFMVIHPSAVLQYTKHAIPKMISPDQNQNADAWIYAYRSYGLAGAYDNKKTAIFAHVSAT